MVRKKTSIIFLFYSLKSQGKAGRDFCLSSMSVSHTASRGCSLGGTVYTPSLTQDVPKVTIKPFVKGTNKKFTYAWSYGLCDVIQHVINKSKFSKAQAVCFQSNPSGKHFYFHTALFWISCFVFFFFLWFSRSSYDLYHLLSKFQCRQYWLTTSI